MAIFSKYSNDKFIVDGNVVIGFEVGEPNFGSDFLDVATATYTDIGSVEYSFSFDSKEGRFITSTNNLKVGEITSDIESIYHINRTILNSKSLQYCQIFNSGINSQFTTLPEISGYEIELKCTEANYESIILRVGNLTNVSILRRYASGSFAVSYGSLQVFDDGGNLVSNILANTLNKRVKIVVTFPTPLTPRAIDSYLYGYSGTNIPIDGVIIYSITYGGVKYKTNNLSNFTNTYTARPVILSGERLDTSIPVSTPTIYLQDTGGAVVRGVEYVKFSLDTAFSDINTAFTNDSAVISYRSFLQDTSGGYSSPIKFSNGSDLTVGDVKSYITNQNIVELRWNKILSRVEVNNIFPSTAPIEYLYNKEVIYLNDGASDINTITLESGAYIEFSDGTSYTPSEYPSTLEFLDVTGDSYPLNEGYGSVIFSTKGDEATIVGNYSWSILDNASNNSIVLPQHSSYYSDFTYPESAAEFSVIEDKRFGIKKMFTNNKWKTFNEIITDQEQITVVDSLQKLREVESVELNQLFYTKGYRELGDYGTNSFNRVSGANFYICTSVLGGDVPDDGGENIVSTNGLYIFKILKDQLTILDWGGYQSESLEDFDISLDNSAIIQSLINKGLPVVIPYGNFFVAESIYIDNRYDLQEASIIGYSFSGSNLYTNVPKSMFVVSNSRRSTIEKFTAHYMGNAITKECAVIELGRGDKRGADSNFKCLIWDCTFNVNLVNDSKYYTGSNPFPSDEKPWTWNPDYVNVSHPNYDFYDEDWDDVLGMSKNWRGGGAHLFWISAMCKPNTYQFLYGIECHLSSFTGSSVGVNTLFKSSGGVNNYLGGSFETPYFWNAKINVQAVGFIADLYGYFNSSYIDSRLQTNQRLGEFENDSQVLGYFRANRCQLNLAQIDLNKYGLNNYVKGEIYGVDVDFGSINLDSNFVRNLPAIWGYNVRSGTKLKSKSLVSDLNGVVVDSLGGDYLQDGFTLFDVASGNLFAEMISEANTFEVSVYESILATPDDYFDINSPDFTTSLSSSVIGTKVQLATGDITIDDPYLLFSQRGIATITAGADVASKFIEVLIATNKVWNLNTILIPFDDVKVNGIQIMVKDGVVLFDSKDSDGWKWVTNSIGETNLNNTIQNIIIRLYFSSDTTRANSESKLKVYGRSKLGNIPYISEYEDSLNIRGNKTFKGSVEVASLKITDSIKAFNTPTSKFPVSKKDLLIELSERGVLFSEEEVINTGFAYSTTNEGTAIPTAFGSNSVATNSADVPDDSNGVYSLKIAVSTTANTTSHTFLYLDGTKPPIDDALELGSEYTISFKYKRTGDNNARIFFTGMGALTNIVVTNNTWQEFTSTFTVSLANPYITLYAIYSSSPTGEIGDAILIDDFTIVKENTEYLGDSGTVIYLNSDSGRYYNMSSASSSTTYTYDSNNLIVGGSAVCLINAPTEPTITGATKVKGSTFIPNTDMHMAVWYYGVTVQYNFIEL